MLRFRFRFGVVSESIASASGNAGSTSVGHRPQAMLSNQDLLFSSLRVFQDRIQEWLSIFRPGVPLRRRHHRLLHSPRELLAREFNTATATGRIL